LEFHDLNGFYQDYIANNVIVETGTPVELDLNLHLHNALVIPPFFDLNDEAGIIT
jgi:hypothetical protein